MPRRLFLAVVGVVATSFTPQSRADCPPDCNKDGRLNINDFICFQSEWKRRTPYGDYDGSGTYTVNDFIRFQADFAATVASGGCPSGDVVATELAGNALGTYPLFEFVDSFNTGSTVSIAIDPARFTAIAGRTADAFVVNHKTAAEWTADPSLTDVRGAAQVVSFGSDLASSRFALSGSGALPTGTGTQIARAFDLVIDTNRNDRLDSGDYIDGAGAGPGFWTVKDLTAPGSLTVQQVSPFVVTWPGIGLAYDEERVFYPSDIATRGKVPLVIISHGAGHQYIFYDYIGNHLASYGCVVMAHQSNIAGIDTAANHTLRHTDAFLDQLGAIGGGALIGHVDTDRIIFIGHSRGGEGVVRAYSFLVQQVYVPTHYGAEGIILVNPIAPVVEGEPDVTAPYDVNFALIYGSADADVGGYAWNYYSWPFVILDRAEGNRSSTYVQGAGHNDFCTGCFRDFAGPPGTEIGREEAQQVAKASFLALVKLYAEGDRSVHEYLWRQFESLRPVGTKSTTIVDRECEVPAGADRYVIDDFQTNPSPSVASTGAAVAYSVTDIYEGLMQEVDGTYVWSASDPMNGMSRATPTDSTKGVVFGWNGATAYYETAVPGGGRDFTGFTYLSFRTCQQTQHPLTKAKLEDLSFTVTLRDGAGKSSSINFTAYGAGIEEAYQRQDLFDPPGWQNEFETIRIRLTDFTHAGTDLDLKNIAAVRLDFGPGFGSPEGRIGLDDVEVIR